MDQAEVQVALEEAAVDQVKKGFETVINKISGGDEWNRVIGQFEADLRFIQTALEQTRKVAAKVFNDSPD